MKVSALLGLMQTLLFLCFVHTLTVAQESSGPASAPVAVAPLPAEEEDAAPLSISGFVDAYYFHSFNNTVFPTSFTPNNKSFSLGMANVVFSKTGKVGFVADLAFGPRAEAANGYAGSSLALIKQLFVTYAPSDALTLTLGNFGTHVGYELIDSKSNINYSTSYLFSYGPFFHTGLKANLALSDRFGLMLGVFNDTDTKIDVVSGKHLGGQLSYAGDKLSAYLNYIGGRVADEDELTPETMAHQIDLTASFKASDAFGLGLNATVKTVKPDGASSQSWSGAALYAKYALSDWFTLGVRGELVNDGDGLITGLEDDSITSFTLSGNFYLGPVTIIPEIRVDNAKQEATYTSLEGKGLKSASGALLAVVYSF